MIARYAILLFLIITILAIPLGAFLLCRWLLPKRYGRWVGLVLAALLLGMIPYGIYVGFEKLEVHQMEFASSDLPEAFDGYRIVQFSDAHVGTYGGSRMVLLRQLVDSINAQHADAIVFTGDLQNLRPDELTDKMDILSQLHAPDGVYSILGNHDYSIYLDTDEATKAKYSQKTQQYERKMGWQLLMNEHRCICRDSDSIVIAGMENWGKMKRMPRRGDVRKTMEGVAPSSFVVMLQHDPSCWREKILPECHAQLTLSGHTHGGQFAIFGWSPVAFSYDEWKGTTYEGDRALHVSVGAGGLIPFRLGMSGEIVVITLKKK